MRSKCYLWTNQESFSSFVEKTNYVCTSVALTISAVFMILRIEEVSNESKLVGATVMGTGGLVMSIVGVIVGRRCNAINYVRLTFKILLLGLFILLYKLGTLITIYQELAFFFIHAYSLNISNDDPGVKFQGRKAVDCMLWLITGACCLIANFPNKVTYICISLNCTSPSILLLVFILQPKKKKVTLPIDFSPTKESILISSQRQDLTGFSNSNKKMICGNSQVSYMDIGVRPKHINIYPNTKHVPTKRRQSSKKASELLWSYPYADGTTQKSSIYLI